MDNHERRRLNTLERDKAFLPFFQEHSLKPQIQIAEMLGWTRKKVERFFQRHPGIPRNHQRGGVAERSAHWSGGRIVDKDGYILILQKDHPHADSGGYVREHRLVMEGMIGRYLEPVEVVHHRNNIKDDNRPENLELLPDNRQNIRYAWQGQHHSQETREKMSQSALQVWSQRKENAESATPTELENGVPALPESTDPHPSSPGTDQLALF